MGKAVRLHAVEHADVIYFFTDFGKEFRNMDARLSTLAKLPARTEQPHRVNATLLNVFVTIKGHGFAVFSIQAWLVIKCLHLRGATLHEHKNDTFCPRRKMWRL